MLKKMILKNVIIILKMIIYNDYFYIIDIENKNIELIKLEENNK